MAGVKITDLELLTTPVASDDLLYIVDVSDTTESPQGTSKAIEVGNLALIESATWTPVITTSYQSSVLFKALYTKLGNCVNFSINFSLTNVSSPILFGDTFFTPPTGLTPTTNFIGSMSFKTNVSNCNSNATSYTVGTDGTSIVHSMINSSALTGYNIIIQGTYLIA
jgi:hypothetical protein